MREKNWYLDLGNKKQRRKGKNKKIDPRKNKRKRACEVMLCIESKVFAISLKIKKNALSYK